MKKLCEPFQLVVHRDEAGVRATVEYRTRVWDDDGTLLTNVTKAASLEQLRADFPWGDFLADVPECAESIRALAVVAELETQLVEKDAILQAILKKLQAIYPEAANGK